MGELRTTGNTSYKTGDFAAALEAFLSGVQVLETSSSCFPKNYRGFAALLSELHTNISLTHNKRGEFDESLAHALIAKEADPSRPKSFHLLGGAYGALSKHTDAAQAYWDGFSLIADANDALKKKLHRLFLKQVALGKAAAAVG